MTANKNNQQEQKTLRGFIVKSADGTITHTLATISDGGWLCDPNGKELQLQIGKNTNGSIVAPVTEDM